MPHTVSFCSKMSCKLNVSMALFPRRVLLCALHNVLEPWQADKTLEIKWGKKTVQDTHTCTIHTQYAFTGGMHRLTEAAGDFHIQPNTPSTSVVHMVLLDLSVRLQAIHGRTLSRTYWTNISTLSIMVHFFVSINYSFLCSNIYYHLANC